MVALTLEFGGTRTEQNATISKMQLFKTTYFREWAVQESLVTVFRARICTKSFLCKLGIFSQRPGNAKHWK